MFRRAGRRPTPGITPPDTARREAPPAPAQHRQNATGGVLGSLDARILSFGAFLESGPKHGSAVETLAPAERRRLRPLGW